MLSCKKLTKQCVENIFKRADHWQLVLQNKRLLPDNFKNKILVNAFLSQALEPHYHLKVRCIE